MTDAEYQFYACGCSAYVTYERNAAGDVLNCTVLNSPEPCKDPSVHP